jgi:hypothetical protein
MSLYGMQNNLYDFEFHHLTPYPPKKRKKRKRPYLLKLYTYLYQTLCKVCELHRATLLDCTPTCVWLFTFQKEVVVVVVVLVGHHNQPSVGGRPITKPGDYGTPNAHNRWFILIYHVRGPAWIETHWNSIWLRARSRMTSHSTWGSVTTLHDFGGELGQPLDTFLLSSHNFIFTALGSCVEWPSATTHTSLRPK